MTLMIEMGSLKSFSVHSCMNEHDCRRSEGCHAAAALLLRRKRPTHQSELKVGLRTQAEPEGRIEKIGPSAPKAEVTNTNAPQYKSTGKRGAYNSRRIEHKASPFTATACRITSGR